MSLRESPIYIALQRPKLIAGIERELFGALALLGSMSFGMGKYQFLLLIPALYPFAVWMGKRDESMLKVFLSYTSEAHVYDSMPRPKDMEDRPKGWGQGIRR